MPSRDILRLGRSAAGWMCASFLVGLLLSALMLGQAWLLSRIFTTLYSWNLSRLPMLLSMFAVVLLVRPLVMLVREFFVTFIGQRIKVDVRLKILRHINRLGPFGLSSKRTGEAESLVTDGCELLEDYYGRYIPQVGVTFITVIVAFIFLIQLDPLVAVVGGLAALLTRVLPKMWNNVLDRRGYKHWEQYAQMNADAVDSMQGMTTLQLFNAVDKYREKIISTSKSLLNATLSQMRVSLLESAISAWLVHGGPVMILAFGIIQAARDEMAVPQLFWCMFLGFELFRPFQDLSANWHAGFHGYSTAKKIIELLATPTPQKVDLEHCPLPSSNEINITNLSFQYSNAEKPAIVKFNLQINAGETVALVGSSGCGKSTLLGLLLRFADPSTGHIAVGGTDIRCLSREDLGMLITLVPQEPIIFDGTIADNLRACNPRATDAQLLDLCLTLGLDDIAPANELLSTQVQERGKGVSGGQRQRLAIARALLRDTPILLLDEATSALDVRAEQLVYTALQKQRQKLSQIGKSLTVIMAAHRMNTVRNADNIVVISNGVIAETGIHEQLILNNGIYSSLIEADRELI